MSLEPLALRLDLLGPANVNPEADVTLPPEICKQGSGRNSYTYPWLTISVCSGRTSTDVILSQ